MWLRKNWLECKKVKTLNSCWKKVDLLKFFRAVLQFLTTADAVAIDRCMNFIHFYFFCIEIVFTFLLWWGIFYLDNIKFFFLDVAFSTMITFSTSSDVVTTTTTSLLLPFPCKTSYSFYHEQFSPILFHWWYFLPWRYYFCIMMLHFLPWCCLFYLNWCHFLSSCCIFYHDLAFSTLIKWYPTFTTKFLTLTKHYSILIKHYSTLITFSALMLHFSSLIQHFIPWWHFLPLRCKMWLNLSILIVY